MIKLFEMGKKIDRHRVDLDLAIQEVLDSGNLILGSQVAEFENEFAEYLRANFFISVANGTDALEIAMRALGVKRYSKVALVANAGNYARTAINLIEASPIYMDVNSKSRNIELSDVKKAVKEGAKFVVATHLYGKAIDQIGAIKEYCAQEKVFLIEDCAQAHGAEVSGKMVGTFGDASCFSFYPTKNLGALGDAGGIATNSEELNSQIRSLRTYGWEDKYQVKIKFGRNSRMDELQAAALRIFLKNLDSDNLKRNLIAKRYTKANTEAIFEMPEFTGNDYVAHLFVVSVDDPENAINYFNSLGIQTARHYPILDTEQPYLEGAEGALELPFSMKLVQNSFTLPCHPEMSPEEIDKVEIAITKYRFP